MQDLSQTKLLIGITGSIGVLNMPGYLQILLQVFPKLKVIMTDCSEFFISKSSMALIADQIYTKMFPLPEKRESCHVPLARWADLFIVLPSTAHVIAQVAHGLANSLLTATILAHTKPIIFFPNMNDAMLNNPATRRNISLLHEYGHFVISPFEQLGYEYASGGPKEGGYMPLPDQVIEILRKELDKRKNLGQKEKREMEPATNR